MSDSSKEVDTQLWKYWDFVRFGLKSVKKHQKTGAFCHFPRENGQNFKLFFGPLGLISLLYKQRKM